MISAEEIQETETFKSLPVLRKYFIVKKENRREINDSIAICRNIGFDNWNNLSGLNNWNRSIVKELFDDYGYDEMITIERMWDYEEKSFSLESSEESFRSLLQSNGLYFEYCCGNLIDDGVVGETCCHKPNGIKGKLIILKQK